MESNNLNPKNTCPYNLVGMAETGVDYIRSSLTLESLVNVNPQHSSHANYGGYYVAGGQGTNFRMPNQGIVRMNQATSSLAIPGLGSLPGVFQMGSDGAIHFITVTPDNQQLNFLVKKVEKASSNNPNSVSPMIVSAVPKITRPMSQTGVNASISLNRTPSQVNLVSQTVPTNAFTSSGGGGGGSTGGGGTYNRMLCPGSNSLFLAGNGDMINNGPTPISPTSFIVRPQTTSSIPPLQVIEARAGGSVQQGEVTSSTPGGAVATQSPKNILSSTLSYSIEEKRGSGNTAVLREVVSNSSHTHETALLKQLSLTKSTPENDAGFTRFYEQVRKAYSSDPNNMGPNVLANIRLQWESLSKEQREMYYRDVEHQPRTRPGSNTVHTPKRPAASSGPTNVSHRAAARHTYEIPEEHNYSAHTASHDKASLTADCRQRHSELKVCAKLNCCNMAKFSEDRGYNYCSSDCVVNHCKDVFRNHFGDVTTTLPAT